MNKRFVEEFSICIGNLAMFFFFQELLLASLDVRSNGIEVVVRVPEQHSGTERIRSMSSV